MNKIFLQKVTKHHREKEQRHRWGRIVLFLSLTVALMTSVVMIRPAITLETNPICGIEEHTHTSGCYVAGLICGQEERQAVPAKEERSLNCSLNEHAHTSECMDEEGQIICGNEVHVHGEACYQVTYIPETEGHAHSNACYQEVRVCQKTEHVHADSCYPKETPAPENLTPSADDTASAPQAPVPETVPPAAETPETKAQEAETSAVKETETQKVEETEAKVEETKAAETEMTEKEEPDTEAKESETVSEKETEPVWEAVKLTARGADYTITVEASAAAKLPQETVLTVRELKENTTPQEYSAYTQRAREKLLQSGKEMLYGRYFDLTLKADGKEIQPAVPVTVTIAYTTAVQEPDESEVKVVSFGDMTELLDVQKKGSDHTWIEAGTEIRNMTVLAFAGIGTIEPESESESETELTSEAESESETELTSETESESETELTSEAESESETELTSEAESESETELISEAESESETELTSEAESESETELTSEVESESETELTSEVESESETELTSEAESESETETALSLEISDTSVDEETGLVLVTVTYSLGKDWERPIEVRLYAEDQKNLAFPQFENYRYTNEEGQLFKLVKKTAEQYCVRYQLRPGEAFSQTFQIGVSELEAGESAEFSVYLDVVGENIPEDSTIDRTKYALTYTAIEEGIPSLLDLQPGESITFYASLGGSRGTYQVTVKKGDECSYGTLGWYKTYKYIVTVPDLAIYEEVAFCVQPDKPGPPNGTYELNSLNSDLLAKVCYYTKNWGIGFFAKEAKEEIYYEPNEVFALGHITASKVWGDSEWNLGVNETGEAAADRMIAYCQEQPDMSFSVSNLKVEGYYWDSENDSWRQKTGTTTFVADNITIDGKLYKQTYVMTLPDGVQLHIGNEVQTGTVTIEGGTTFYLSAPLYPAGMKSETYSYSSPTVTVSHLEGLQSYEILTPDNVQTLALVFGNAEEVKKEINFHVNWNKGAMIGIAKTDDSETPKPLSGAEFQVLSVGTAGSTKEGIAGSVVNESPVSINGNLVTLTTDANGKAKMPTMLAPGNYILRETKAPDGYVKAEDISFTIAENGTVTVTSATGSVSSPNPESGSTIWEFQVVDKKIQPTELVLHGTKTLTGRTLQDDEFQFSLYEVQEDNTTEEKLIQTVTNKDGKFAFNALTYKETGTYHYRVKEVEENLPGVQYDSAVYDISVEVLQDTTAKEKLTTHVTITKSELGSGDSRTTSSPVESISFKNTFSGSVTLKKTGRKNVILPGAEFQLYQLDANGQGQLYPDTNTNTVYTTDAWGTITVMNLPAGSYYFVEKKAPEGYEITKDENGKPKQYPFEISAEKDQAGKDQVHVTLDPIVNEPSKKNVIFKKISLDTTEGTTSLAGAKFTLYEKEGEQETLVPNVLKEASDENGIFSVDNASLPYGTYVLRETTAPSGYKLADEVLLTVNEEGLDVKKMDGSATDQVKIDYNSDTDIYTVTVKDAPKANIRIIKVDADSEKKLAGASFKLMNGSEAVNIPNVTDENGILLSNLSDGTYTLTEVSAPSGYIIETSDLTFTIKDGIVALSEKSSHAYSKKTTDKDGSVIIEIYVKNKAGMELPATGGSGTGMLYLIGILLVLGSGIWYCMRRKIC